MTVNDNLSFASRDSSPCSLLSWAVVAACGGGGDLFVNNLVMKRKKLKEKKLTTLQCWNGTGRGVSVRIRNQHDHMIGSHDHVDF